MRSTTAHRQLALGLALGFLIAGCMASAPAQCPTVLSPVVVCLPVREWSPAQQSAALAEYSALEPKAQLRQFILDYQAMRDAARACKGAQPNG